MLRRLNHLRNYAIEATDGPIGVAADFFFDDRSWIIRYIVVNAGSWLRDRLVLISPAAVLAVTEAGRRISVTLTQSQVRDSPDIDTHRPVSRQMELKLAEYYTWPMYWIESGMVPEVITAPALPPIDPALPGPAEDRAPTDDSGLRSEKEVSGYSIEAGDGAVGHLEDFLLEDDTWTIRYLLIDTGNWWPGKKVLLSPRWVSHFQWSSATVHADLTRDAIQRSPSYDPAMPVTREYEERLFDHYSRPKYWQ